jgi:hypothetical protein
MSPEITVMEIDKSKFYLIGIRFESNMNYEMMHSVVEEIDDYLKSKEIEAAILPLGLEAQDIIELDESLSKDLLEIIQQYKDKKAEGKG